MNQTRIGNLELFDYSRVHPETFAKVSPDKKVLVIIHHTATGPDMTIADLYRAHRQYGGIGYNALVYPSGRAYLVGDWNTSRAGAAQSSQLNRIAYHLAFVGNLSLEEPMSAAIETMRALVANINYSLGRGLVVAPHCLFNVDRENDRSRWNTECPGTTWPEWWQSIIGG